MSGYKESLTVSAVIALYNGEAHIIDAIESILQQTQSVIEIVVVNDGSSDSSLEVISNYLQSNQEAKQNFA